MIPHCKPGQTRRDLHGAAACDCAYTIDIGTFSEIPYAHVKALYFDSSPYLAPLRWVYDQTGEVESHSPEDRTGLPFGIPHFCEETEGERWFLFTIEDSHFPSRFLVRGTDFEHAHENFVDAEVARFKIDDDALPDYFPDGKDMGDHDWEGYTGQHSSDGTPVDTDNVTGGEIFLTRIDFQVKP